MEGKPVVITDSQLINAESITAVLERAMIWLTPKTVEAYDPAAFEEWSGILQAELKDAVERFRRVASTIPPDKPATAPQARDGVQAFSSLKEAVLKVTLSEWLHEARGLINQVEAWAKDFGWVTRRQEKKLNELLLGEYTLDQLYMHAEGSLYILDPIARFIPGGLGAFDLSIQPSFYITSIYRHMDGGWYIHLDVGQGVRGAKKELMSAAALKRAIEELRSLL
jgi:hypothetical protein